MKKVLILVVLLVSSNLFAKLDSKEFVDCLEYAINEVIPTMKNKTRICESLSGLDKDAYNDSLDGYNVYGSSVGRIYYDLKNITSCYENYVEGDGIIQNILNSPTYHRNLKLLELSFKKIIGEKMWPWKQFGTSSPNATKKLSEFNLEYCYSNGFGFDEEDDGICE